MLQFELVRDAKNASALWAQYVVSAEPKLDEVFQKKSVDHSVSDVFNRTYPAIRTLYYELYDADRGAFFISYMNVKFEFKSFPPVDRIIAPPKPGEPPELTVEFHHEEDQGKVLHFATVAVPYVSSGKVLGYIVSYINQTSQRAALEQSFHRVALLIVVILAISVFGPAVLVIVRNKDKQKSRTALRKSEQLFLKAFHANPVPFSISSPSGFVHDVNDAWLTTLGYTREEAIGASSYDLNIWLDPKDRAKFVELLQKTGVVNNYETQYRSKDGKVIDMVVSGELVEVDGERRLFNISYDVTASNKAKQDLVEHRDLLQQKVDEATADLELKARRLETALAKEKELNELQRQFVSMASHEFRTPLAIIDQTAQRLKRKVENNQVTPQMALDRIGKIRKAVIRMTRLMDSTLTAARLDEGQVKVEIKPCNIKGLLREVCARQQDISENHVITCDVDNLPDTVMADSNSLDQIFTNLLSNAVKYSPDVQQINVKGQATDSTVVIAVQDYGLGIDQDDLPNMFNRFFRAKTSLGIAGTGIGLHMVKILAELHDGSIEVESRKGEGSTFTIRLPINGPAGKNLQASGSAAA